jgi:hypothetical protein
MNQVLFRFILLAPLVGNMAFAATREYPVVAESMSLFTIEGIASLVGGGIFVGILGLFLAYPIGLFPAAVAGLMYWLFLKKMSHVNPSIPLRLVAGAFVGGLCSSLFGGLLFSPQDPEAARLSLVAWSMAGVFGGAVSAASIGQKTYRIAKEF